MQDIFFDTGRGGMRNRKLQTRFVAPHYCFHCLLLGLVTRCLHRLDAVHFRDPIVFTLCLRRLTGQDGSAAGWRPNQLPLCGMLHQTSSHSIGMNLSHVCRILSCI